MASLRASHGTAVLAFVFLVSLVRANVDCDYLPADIDLRQSNGLICSGRPDFSFSLEARVEASLAQEMTFHWLVAHRHYTTPSGVLALDGVPASNRSIPLQLCVARGAACAAPAGKSGATCARARLTVTATMPTPQRFCTTLLLCRLGRTDSPHTGWLGDANPGRDGDGGSSSDDSSSDDSRETPSTNFWASDRLVTSLSPVVAYEQTTVNFTLVLDLTQLKNSSARALDLQLDLVPAHRPCSSVGDRRFFARLAPREWQGKVEHEHGSGGSGGSGGLARRGSRAMAADSATVHIDGYALYPEHFSPQPYGVCVTFVPADQSVLTTQPFERQAGVQFEVRASGAHPAGPWGLILLVSLPVIALAVLLLLVCLHKVCRPRLAHALLADDGWRRLGDDREMAAMRSEAGSTAATLTSESFDNVSLTPLVPSRRARDAAVAPPVEEVPPDLVCPITGQIMVDPVTAEDGVTYERAAIAHWIATKETSPTTGQPISKLYPNYLVRTLVQDFRNKAGGRQG